MAEQDVLNAISALSNKIDGLGVGPWATDGGMTWTASITVNGVTYTSPTPLPGLFEGEGVDPDPYD